MATQYFASFVLYISTIYKLIQVLRSVEVWNLTSKYPVFSVMVGDTYCYALIWPLP